MDISNIVRLPFMRKPLEEKEVNKVAVVINTINHASLIAGTLYTLLLREHTSLSAVLIDVRDPFPTDVDLYVWMDCGTSAQFQEYYRHAVAGSLTPDEDRKWYANVVRKSKYIIPDTSPTRTPEETVIGSMLQYASNLNTIRPDLFGGAVEGEKKHASVPADVTRLYMRYAVLEESFSSDMSAEDCCLYYDAIEMAYQFYHGMPLTLSHFEGRIPTTEEIRLFLEAQKEINKILTLRCRVINVMGRNLYYLTSTGPDVHGLIRRITLAKKDYVHVSTGSYGSVLCASVCVPNGVGFEKGALNLSPPQLEQRKIY